jgi:hypothetical protein
MPAALELIEGEEVRRWFVRRQAIPFVFAALTAFVQQVEEAGGEDLSSTGESDANFSKSDRRMLRTEADNPRSKKIS